MPIKNKIVSLFILFFISFIVGCGDNASLRLESIENSPSLSPQNGNKPQINIGSGLIKTTSGYKMSAGVRNVSTSDKSCGSSGYCMQIGISK